VVLRFNLSCSVVRVAHLSIISLADLPNSTSHTDSFSDSLTLSFLNQSH